MGQGGLGYHTLVRTRNSKSWEGAAAVGGSRWFWQPPSASFPSRHAKVRLSFDRPDSVPCLVHGHPSCTMRPWGPAPATLLVSCFCLFLFAAAATITGSNQLSSSTAVSWVLNATHLKATITYGGSQWYGDSLLCLGSGGGGAVIGKHTGFLDIVSNGHSKKWGSLMHARWCARPLLHTPHRSPIARTHHIYQYVVETGVVNHAHLRVAWAATFVWLEPRLEHAAET